MPRAADVYSFNTVLTADTQRLKRDLSKATRQWRRATADVRAQIGTLARYSATAGIAITGAFAAGAKQALDLGDQIDKASKRVGVSAEGFQRLAHVFNLSGATATSLENSVNKLGDSIGKAHEGIRVQLEAFQELGLEMEHIRGLTLEETFREVAQRIAEMEDPARRIYVQTQLIGRGGRALNGAFYELLRNGNIRELEQQLDDLGGVIDGRVIAETARLTDVIATYTTVVKAQFTTAIYANTQGWLDNEESIRNVGDAVFVATSAFFELGRILYDHRNIVLQILTAWIALRVAIFSGQALAAIGATIKLLGVMSATIFAMTARITKLKKVLGIGLIGIVAETAYDLIRDFADLLPEDERRALDAWKKFNRERVEAVVEANGELEKEQNEAQKKVSAILKGELDRLQFENSLLKDGLDKSLEALGGGDSLSTLRNLANDLSGVIEDIKFIRTELLEQGFDEATINELTAPLEIRKDLLEEQIEELKATLSTEELNLYREFTRQAPTAGEEAGKSFLSSYADQFKNAADDLGITEFFADMRDVMANPIESAEGLWDSFMERINQRAEELRKRLDNLPAVPAQGSAITSSREFGDVFFEDESLLEDLDVPSPQEVKTRLQTTIDSTVTELPYSLGDSIARAITSGDFKSVGNAVVDVLNNAITQSIGALLGQALSGLFSGLFSSLFSSASGSAAGSAIGGVFHEGGIVPGPRGAERIILAQAGELVLTPEQQEAVEQRTSGGITVNIQGDVTRQVRREVATMIDDIVLAVDAGNRLNFAG